MKKKLNCHLFSNPRKWIKAYWLMRNFIILFFVFNLSAFSNGLTQQVASVKYEDASLLDVFENLKEQTGYGILYKQNEVDFDVRVNMTKQNVSVQEVLSEALEGTNLTYKVQNEVIVVYKEVKKLHENVAPPVQEKKKITGTVTDDVGVRLPGVSVVAKGTAIGTATGIDGDFNLTVPAETTEIVVSFIGMITQGIELNGQANFAIVLKSDTENLDEVVAIGYGVQKKSDLSGAVASIKQEDVRKYATANVGQALQGRMAGVEVTSASGKPGAGVDIKIRGTATLGSNKPLYIVDGIPDDINNVSPNDIESIEVLKDGAAAAIYGSRAANGVVLITTKTGKKGAAKVQFNTYYGVESISKKLDLCNAEEHVRIIDQAYKGDGLDPFYGGEPSSYGTGTDWVEELFSPSTIQNYNLSFSGGTEDFKGSMSLDYFNQEGIVLNTGFERISARLNGEYSKGKIRITQNLGIYSSGEEMENASAVWRALEMPPTISVYDENNVGGYAGTYGNMFDIMNPIAAQNLIKRERTKDHIQANFSISYELLTNLTAKLNTGTTLTNIYDYSHSKVYVMPILSNTLPRMSETRGRSVMWLTEGTLNYNFSINKSAFKILAGVSAQNNTYRSTYAKGAGMPNDKIDVISAATQEIDAGGTEWNYRLSSQFGRLNYNFDNRYLASFTVRRDGSSRFGTENKWGVFPSASLAWRISEEKFFPETEFLNDVKFRMSYGVLGNQEIGNYAFSSSINSSQHYVFGASQDLFFGASQLAFATPEIKWETNISKNIGFDFVMANNQLIVNVDYFMNDSKDILVRVPIPGSNGSNVNPYQNIGRINNRGIELSTNLRKEYGDLKIDLGFTIASIKNEVKKLGKDDQVIWAGKPYHLADNTTLTKVGEEIASFYLIKTDGIFKSQQEVDNYVSTNSETGEISSIQPNAVPGDIRFKDANGDGVINGDDRVYSGSAMPDFTYGLHLGMQFKSFDFSCFFQGVHGNKIFNGVAYSLEGLPNFTNMDSKLLNAWTLENSTSNIPRVTFSDANGNGRTQSDRFLQDGSYLRLKSIQLGYSLPKSLFNDLKLSQGRVYISGQNIFTLTNYGGFDPDVARDGLLQRGVDNGVYPPSKTFLIGLQLTF